MARKKNKKEVRQQEKSGGRFRFPVFGGMRSWYGALRPETRESIVGVVFVLFASLMLFAWFGKAGPVGQVFYRASFFLFGQAFLLLPLSTMLLGVAFLFSIERRFFPSVLFGGAIFLLASLGLVDVLSRGIDRPAGFVGDLMASGVTRMLDVWAGGVALFGLLIVGLLVLFDIPLVRKSKRDEATLGASAIAPVTTPQMTFPETVSTVAAQVPGQAEAESEGTEPNDLVVHTMDRETRTSGKERRTSPLYPNYQFPPFSLLEDDRGHPSSGDIKANANVIQRTLLEFGIPVEMGEVHVGPTVTQYTLKPAQGVKISRISGLGNDLALALAAHPLRIEAPIPGKSLVGIEIPNRSIMYVGLRGLLENGGFSKGNPLTFPVGRDVRGDAVYADLASMPHLLIAGSTGSGKSVAIHAILMSLLYKNTPNDLQLLLIDPKRVELTYYNDLPHLITPVVITPKGAIKALRWAVEEMEKRYETLASAKARDIASYNAKTEEKLPYLVIVIDELADLMATAPREIEASIVRIAQMARAVGIHLMVSTQRPSVEVITGLIKANITSRIAFQVASQIDSRTILDGMGAEKLLGHGDMLFLRGDAGKPRRIQGTFITDKEVKSVTDFIRKEVPDVTFGMEFNGNGGSDAGSSSNDAVDDDLYEEAKTLVISTQKASASFLQRRLRVGYARAARLLDLLEEQGVIGPGEGAKPRDVFIKSDSAHAESGE